MAYIGTYLASAITVVQICSAVALLLLCNYDHTIIEAVRKRNDDEKQTSLFEHTKRNHSLRWITYFKHEGFGMIKYHL